MLPNENYRVLKPPFRVDGLFAGKLILNQEMNYFFWFRRVYFYRNRAVFFKCKMNDTITLYITA